MSLTHWLDSLPPSPSEFGDPYLSPSKNNKRKRKHCDMASSLQDDPDATPIQRRTIARIDLETNTNVTSAQAVFQPPPSPSKSQSPAHATPSDASSQSTASSSLRSGSNTPSNRKRKGDTHVSRTGSPVKRLATLQSGQYGISKQKVRRLPDLPPAVRAIVEPIWNISKGRGIVPSTEEDVEMWKEALGDGTCYSDQLIQQAQYPAPGTAQALPPSGTHRATIDTVSSMEERRMPPLSAVDRIIAKAKRLYNRGHTENAWNTMVHPFVFEEAVHNSGCEDAVSWVDLTRANPHSGALPTINQAGKKADARRVDFALTLELGPRIERQINWFIPDTNINHTEYIGVRLNPIAVSVETKKPGQGEEEANLQLQTWGVAQLQHLHALLRMAGKDVKVPPLPLLVVEGHHWRLHVMEDLIGPSAAAQLKLQEGSTTVHLFDHNSVAYWGDVPFGNTDDRLGTYQAIASLQMLIRWATTIYRPWFIQNILEPIFINAGLRL